MALQDLLGETSLIKIFDFLADNMDCSYNQTEISDFTDLSRTTVNQKIRDMIQNGLVVVDQEAGKIKTFKLASNEIVKCLIAASLVHSFREAENPLSDEEQKTLINKMIGDVPGYEGNKYYYEPEPYIRMMIEGCEIVESGKKIVSEEMNSA